MAKINLSRKRLEDYVDITEFNSDNEKIEDHTSKTATSRSSGHVKLSDTANEEEGKNSGIAVTPKALHDATSGVSEKVDKLSKDYAEHEKLEGTYQVAGHVKLSNAVNSQSSVSDGVAATPKAVKDAYDKADNHANDKNNPHKVTKAQVGLGNVDNVKQATKSEFDRHAGLIGSFGAAGHVKLSNHTTSENSVGDGVAATPLAVKTVNDKIDALDSEDINLINRLPSDAPLTDYPRGVTSFYINVTDEGYPHQYGTVTTYTDNRVTGYQTFVLNNFNASRRKIYIRYYHNTTGWSDWYQIADDRDISDAKDLAEQALTLGDKQRERLADSLSSKGVSLPSSPSWDRLQSEVAGLKNVKKATVEVSEGQTNIPLPFKPDVIEVEALRLGVYVSYGRVGDGAFIVVNILAVNRQEVIPLSITDNSLILNKDAPVPIKITAYGGLN